MSDNEIKANLDRRILATVIEAMTPEQVREWFIKMKMAEHRQNYTDIAKRHRLSKWYLSGAVHGKYGFTPRTVHALEADLSINLRPFLNGAELLKLRKVEK
ncbi:MAG: hypothetical protein ABIJ26_01435 [Candidatus Margulisiibacteriota bacterium]